MPEASEKTQEEQSKGIVLMNKITSETMHVQRYFNQKAPHYTQGTQRGLWNAIKMKEKEAIFYLLEPQSQDVILDAGCGDGYYLSELKSYGCDHLEGVDFSESMVEAARKKGFQASVVNLEEEWNAARKYDKIICIGVLEFCKDNQRILRNLKNALKPEGRIVLLMPPRFFGGYLYRLFHYYWGCRVNIRLFSRKDIEELARRCDLQVEAITRATFLSCVVKLSNPP